MATKISSISITGMKSMFLAAFCSTTRPMSMRCCSNMDSVWMVGWLSMVILICGYCSIKPFRYFTMIKRHKVLLTPMRMCPMLNSRIRFNSISPLVSSSKASRVCSKSTCPSSVSCTPREFRVKSTVFKLSSSLLMDLLIAGWLM